ncbi:hypothetical protein RIVM261_065090 [Rivularia sp. IAM M-261]|nr:hypothetical protein RIVM261_065090 [Rivularia sp. IAM M-261]
MKYIKKNIEPESFTVWKKLASDDWQPCWDNFGKPEKIQVHNSLLREQGFICCYCERRISRDTSHIEHFKPRKHYPDLALEYTNFLASCQRETKPKEPIHCGKKKDEWYDEKLTVSPLIEDCAEFFRFTEDGQILATETLGQKEQAQATIDKLNLNIDKLKVLRSQAIEGALEDFEELSNIEKEVLLQGFEQTNADGEYEEFCSTIVYIMKQLI